MFINIFQEEKNRRINVFLLVIVVYTVKWKFFIVQIWGKLSTGFWLWLIHELAINVVYTFSIIKKNRWNGLEITIHFAQGREAEKDSICLDLLTANKI